MPAPQPVRPEYEIGVAEAQLFAAGKTLTLIDMREPEELIIAPLPGAVHIPGSEFASRIDELLDLSDDAGPEGLGILCHAGVRSFQATMLLRQEGIQNVRSVAGGIDAWSVYLDPSIPRY